MGATVLPTVDEIKPEKLPALQPVGGVHQGGLGRGGRLSRVDRLLRGPDLRPPAAGRRRAIRLGAGGGGAFPTAGHAANAYFKQYYRYARGDGKADLWRKRHLIRYVTYLIALPSLLALSLLHSPGWSFVLLAGVMLYCATPYRRLQPHLPHLASVERVKAVLLLPVIRAVGDVAKMLGYPAGWVWRLRNWRRPEVHWRQSSPKADS